jgi:hypothetical protein
MRALMNRVLVAMFLIVVALPLAVNLAGLDGADPVAENRERAPFPRLVRSVPGLVAYGGALTRWFQDHFGLRARLVRWYGESRMFGLGVSPTAAVLRGTNGWLYYADDSGVEDFTNETLLTPREVVTWQQAVVRAKRWCDHFGVAYVFTVVPDKHVLYPEHVPRTIRQLQPTSRTDQVLNGVSDTGAALDLRPALKGAKGRERLYHLTDTHWNDRGAFIAYEQIIAAVRTQESRVPAAWRRSDFSAESAAVPGMDLARMMGLSHVLIEENLKLVPLRQRRAIVVEPPGARADAEEGRLVTEIPGSDLPRAVIFRDSFAAALAPFLSEHFSRAVYLWRNDFDADSVRVERADVVIQEIVGRHLYVYTPSPEIIPIP